MFSSRVPKKGSSFPVMCTLRFIQLEGSDGARYGWPMDSSCKSAAFAHQTGETTFNLAHPSLLFKLHPCKSRSGPRRPCSVIPTEATTPLVVPPSRDRGNQFLIQLSERPNSRVRFPACTSNSVFRAKDSISRINWLLVRANYLRRYLFPRNSRLSASCNSHNGP